jgi:hypothetical protein
VARTVVAVVVAAVAAAIAVAIAADASHGMRIAIAYRECASSLPSHHHIISIKPS